MHETDRTNKIKDISHDTFVCAVADHAEIEKPEAEKLVRMYKQFSTQNEDETLEDVLENLDLNEDISVRPGGSKS
jgi:NifU-like protein involved in Fe-S cluster formation